MEQEILDKATGQKKVLKNGCLEYIKMIVIPQLGKMEIKTTEGTNKVYTDFKTLQVSPRPCLCV